MCFVLPMLIPQCVGIGAKDNESWNGDATDAVSVYSTQLYLSTTIYEHSSPKSPTKTRLVPSEDNEASRISCKNGKRTIKTISSTILLRISFKFLV